MSPWYRKKRVALPLAALVALVVVIGVGGTGDDSPAPVAGVPVTSTAASSTAIVQPAAAAAAAPKEKATTVTVTKKKVTKKEVEIGDSVRAGDWQFKVTDFDCGRSEVGDEGHVKKPRGQFCVLELSGKNNSDVEGIVAAGDQELSDDDGKTYRSDRKAALADDADSSLFLEGVDPGTTTKGTVVFDVPKKIKITEVTLTGGGVFDGKATVRLR